MNQRRTATVEPADEEIRAVRHVVYIDVRPDQPSVYDENWYIETSCNGHWCQCGEPLPDWDAEPIASVVAVDLTFPFYNAPFAPLYRVDVLERIVPFLVRPVIGRVVRSLASGDREVENYRTLHLSRFGPRLEMRGVPQDRYRRCHICGRVSCKFSRAWHRHYYLRDQLRGGLVQISFDTGMPLVADTVLDKLRLDTLPDARLLQYMKYPLRDEPIDGRRMKMFLPLDEVKARLKKRGWKKPTKKEVRAQLDQMRALGLLISAVNQKPEKAATEKDPREKAPTEKAPKARRTKRE